MAVDEGADTSQDEIMADRHGMTSVLAFPPVSLLVDAASGTSTPGFTKPAAREPSRLGNGGKVLGKRLSGT